MKQSLYRLIVLAVCCGVLDQLAPGGEGGAMSKYLRMLCSLCLLLALAEPVVMLLQTGAALPERIAAYAETLTLSPNASEEAQERWDREQQRLDGAIAARQLALALQSQFSISPDDITVTVRTDASSAQLSHVSVGLSNAAVWQNSHAIEAWIEEQLGCTASVYLE